MPPCLYKFIEALWSLLVAKSRSLKGSLFNYLPVLVKLKHISKWSFLGHASIIFNAWDVIWNWKLHLWTFRIWFYLFQKIAEKALKTRSKLSVARANENLVARLSIVLTQSCMNHEHWVVHQMKVEDRIFPYMYNS